MSPSPDAIGQVVVDYDLCEANGICVGVAPQIFDLDDEDNLHLLATEVTPHNESRIRQAAESCPRAALSIERTHR